MKGRVRKGKVGRERWLSQDKDGHSAHLKAPAQIPLLYIYSKVYVNLGLRFHS